MGGMFGLGEGFDCYIMESDLLTNKAIALFKSAIEQGYDPADVKYEVLEQAGIRSLDDLTESDRRKLYKYI